MKKLLGLGAILISGLGLTSCSKESTIGYKVGDTVVYECSNESNTVIHELKLVYVESYDDSRPDENNVSRNFTFFSETWKDMVYDRTLYNYSSDWTEWSENEITLANVLEEYVEHYTHYNGDVGYTCTLIE